MGLDMYLEKKIWEFEVDGAGDKEVKKIFDLVEKELGRRPQTIGFEVMYWRKANAIHRWFVENVQVGEDNCALYEVTRENLMELLKLINAVLKDRKRAEELLPAMEGFFFGTYTYDKWYFNDLKETKEVLTKELKEKPYGCYTYQSSW